MIDNWKNIDIVDRVVHIHIPKTGGTWLNKHLNNSGVRTYDHSTIATCLSSFNQKFPCWSYDSSPSLGMNIKTQPNYDKFNSACKVAIVRNPFDWLVSYYSQKGTGAWSHHRGWDDIVNTHNIKSFEHFVHHFCDPEKRWWHVWLKRSIFYQIFNEKGEVGVDIVLKKENLTSAATKLFLDLELIKNKSEIDTNFINQTHNAKDYRTHYTPELVDIASDFFHQELSIFGYQFEKTNNDMSYSFAREFSKLDWGKSMQKTKF